MSISAPLLPLSITLAQLLTFTKAFPHPPSYVTLVPLFAHHLALPESTLHLLSTLSSSPQHLLLHLAMSLDLGGNNGKENSAHNSLDKRGLALGSREASVNSEAYLAAWIQVCVAYIKGSGGCDVTDETDLRRLNEMVALFFDRPPVLPASTKSVQAYTDGLFNQLQPASPEKVTLPFPCVPRHSYVNLTHSVVYHAPSAASPATVVVRNCDNVVLHILNNLKLLSLSNCSNVTVINPHASLLAMSDCSNCTVTTTTHCTVVRACHDVTLYTKTTSPILVHASPMSSGIRVGPFNTTFKGISIPQSIMAAPSPTSLFTILPLPIVTNSARQDNAAVCVQMVPGDFELALPPHDLPDCDGAASLNHPIHQALLTIPITLPRAYTEAIHQLLERAQESAGDENRVKREVAKKWEVEVMRGAIGGGA
jgi:hypothetical protein